MTLATPAYLDGSWPDTIGADDWGDNEPSYLDRLRAALVDTYGLDQLADPEPLIGDDILFKDSINWIVGKPGSYKSFLMLDMAGCVGTGEHWQGYQVAKGGVLYLVAEGVRGTKKRVRAWEQAMGIPMANVQFLPVAVQSKVGAHWDALVALAAELQPAMVVLDTQARITVGVEENSNAEMGQFVDAAERLRKATAACVSIVHHIGRNGDTGRGATTLDGAMSTIIKIAKDDDKITLECQKNKDGAEWDDIELRAVPMGESIVLALIDGTEQPGRTIERCASWLAKWDDTFADEWVSVTTLIDGGVVAKNTFHANRLKLLNAGVIERAGEGRQTRYKRLGHES